MSPLRYTAKFDPFLSLDCAPTPSNQAQSKERKGSNFAIWQPCFVKLFQKDILSMNFCHKRFESENTWSLGQLFAGFMQHYDRNFDFTADVASVRTGRILTNVECEAHARAVRNGVGQWKAYVCVEEPFERSNAARLVRIL